MCQIVDNLCYPDMPRNDYHHYNIQSRNRNVNNVQHKKTKVKMDALFGIYNNIAYFTRKNTYFKKYFSVQIRQTSFVLKLIDKRRFLGTQDNLFLQTKVERDV
ncbi:hypothetical protein CEXT_140261 [Caerostris extrusa]|uniref:Uncharacterized protein n=1 Tax=Caerostris extrusa TaxID=172846 RepID=A0AAV4XM33_CAEEX|nr:hypothetical protein CEXT_140261 [Caerostris extrusa]